jgi:hypothetical protein
LTSFFIAEGLEWRDGAGVTLAESAIFPRVSLPTGSIRVEPPGSSLVEVG